MSALPHAPLVVGLLALLCAVAAVGAYRARWLRVGTGAWFVAVLVMLAMSATLVGLQRSTDGATTFPSAAGPEAREPLRIGARDRSGAARSPAGRVCFPRL